MYASSYSPARSRAFCASADMESVEGSVEIRPWRTSRRSRHEPAADGRRYAYYPSITESLSSALLDGPPRASAWCMRCIATCALPPTIPCSRPPSRGAAVAGTASAGCCRASSVIMPRSADVRAAVSSGERLQLASSATCPGSIARKRTYYLCARSRRFRLAERSRGDRSASFDGVPFQTRRSHHRRQP